MANMTSVTKVVEQSHVHLYKESVEISNTYENDTLRHAQNVEYPTYIIYIALYCLIFVLGVFPNSVIFYIILTCKEMQQKYKYTASISIAHMAFCCICIPIIICDLLDVKSAFGTGLCQVAVCLTFSATSLSMLSLAVRRSLGMSERYWFASFIHKGDKNNILAIWSLSFLTALPNICTKQRVSSPFDLTELNDHGTQSKGSDHQKDFLNFLKMCHSVSNKTQATNCTQLDEHNGKAASENCLIDMFLYDTCLVGVLLFLSVLVSLVLQTIVMKGIMKKQNQNHWLKQKRIAKQHMIMLVLFLICWLPLCIVSFAMRKSSLPVWLLTLFNMLAASNVVYNPFLYYILNAYIRRELKLWLRNMANMFVVEERQ